jgi:hypothetical protein
MATGLLLKFNSYTENLGGRTEDDDWSRDATSTTSTLEQVFALDAKESFAFTLKNGDFPACDLVVGAEVGPGDKVFIVWVEYGTSDSFGSDGGNVEMIGAFIDEERAKKCAQDCENFNENDSSTYMDTSRYEMRVELDNGQTYNVWIPWTGYFENLERVHITPMIISDNRK